MNREEALIGFLKSQKLDSARRVKMTGDASARKYHRISKSEVSYILMDAPPPEKTGPFMAMAKLLSGMGLSAPKILAADEEQGFLLLEDFGDRTFTRALNEGVDEKELYHLATDTLIELHRRLPEGASELLPPHDEARALREVNLVLEWYWPAIFGTQPPPQVKEAYEEAWRRVLPMRLKLPPSIALFDFHVDNLMIIAGRNGVAVCGLLDFQDAVIAPMGFDLASLLEDVRRDVPDMLKVEVKARYLLAFKDIVKSDFEEAYQIMAAQRNVRIIGTFARLLRRDQKPHYQIFMPRVWRLVGEHLNHPSLKPVQAWFDRFIPANARHRITEEA